MPPTKFKAPYGTPDQHVSSPAQHFGYVYLVAYLVDQGVLAEAIRRECSEAHAQCAPKDAICRSDSGWHQRGDVRHANTRRRLDAYAASLTTYAALLKQQTHR